MLCIKPNLYRDSPEPHTLLLKSLQSEWGVILIIQISDIATLSRALRQELTHSLHVAEATLQLSRYPISYA